MTLKNNDPYNFHQLGQTDKNEIKRNRLLIEQLLLEDGVKSIPDGQGKFLCPYHNDRNPSAEIREFPSGYYFICYACDLHLDYFALVAFRENIPLRDAFKQASASLDDTLSYLSKGTPQVQTVGTLDGLIANYLQAHQNYQLEEVNHYGDPEVGSCTFATVRFQKPGVGKTIFPASFTSQAGWQFKAPTGKRPLYNLARVREAENILVVEGEKCVNAFTALDIDDWAATTSSGGSMTVSKTEWNQLVGKNVYIWRDYDKAGRRYQDDVISCLRDLKTTTIGINVINLGRTEGWWPDVKEGDDLVDYLKTLDPETDVESHMLHLLHEAEEWNPTTAFKEHLVNISEGKYQLVTLPTLPVFSELTQAGLPGKSTLIVGSPGSAKSFLAMELGWTLNEAEVPTASLFLEDGQIDYQKRCIAQMLGRSEYVSGRWQEQNQAQSQELFGSVRSRLNNYFQHVTCLEAKLWTPELVLDWLRDRADEGYRMVVVDPVTAMEMSNRQWVADQAFVLEMQRIITDSGMSAVLTTHQKTGVKHAGIDGAAGGQSWSRFTHTNVWLRHAMEKGPTLSKVVSAPGPQQVVEHQRELIITKARNGPGVWKRIAVDLDPGTLRFTEYGVILGEVKPGEGFVDTVDPQY